MVKIITLLLFALGLSYTEVYAQTKVQKRIVDDKQEPVSYANIFLFSKKDSLFVEGTTSDEDGKFEITYNPNCFLKISRIGYKTVFLNNYSSGSNITLASDISVLGEVTVTSSLPITKLENDALVTNIKGTILENLGSARDVLGRLPGIMAGKGGISVFGKGVPAIYVNGQLVRNMNMLDQLQSKKIRKIELITNPGSRYDATVSSVIRIVTERSPGEGFSMDSKSVARYSNFMSVSEQVDVNYRHNNLDFFAMSEFDISKTKGTSTNVQNTWTPIHYLQNVENKSTSRHQLYEGKIGFNYQPSSGHSFGAYCQASHKPIKIKSFYDSESWVDKILDETSIIEKDAEAKTTDYLVDGYYSGSIGKWTVDATFDLLWKNGKNNESSKETYLESHHRDITINESSDARMYAGELHLSHPLWKGRINLGVQLSSSQRCEDYINEENVISDGDDKICENNAAAYIETSQNIGTANVRFGLRYEHIDNRYYEMDTKIEEQSHAYDNVFPTASLMLPIRKSILQLSYSRKYERPLYSQLGGTISYVNRYLYQSGNPNLKSQFMDNISLVYRYKWLIFMAEYTHTDGRIIDECMKYGEDGNITLLRKNNSSSALHKYQLIAVAAPHFGIYYPNLMTGIVGQNYKIDYLGEKKHLNKPMLIVRWNNLLSLKNRYLVNIDFNWRGCSNSDNVRLGQTWSLNAGATKQFGKHWNFKLALNDIFNTSRKSDFTIYSGVNDLKMTKWITTRNIECTIRYNFNTSKTKYSGKGAGEKEKNRL